MPAMNNSDEKRAAQGLLLAYCLFILYGSFIPFHFNFDPNFVRWRWSLFLTDSLHERIAHASLSDVVSNILLFIPFGILRMWLWSARVQGKRPLLPTLVTAAYGLIFGVVIESGQTLSPGRISSLLDALCNGLGAFIGAIWGLVLVRSFRGSFKATLVHVLRNQPTLLLLGYLLLGVLANSYFPFDVTLDVSAVWQNIKRSQLVPFQKGFHQYWFELLIEKGAIFAGIGYLVLTNLQRLWRRYRSGPRLAPVLRARLRHRDRQSVLCRTSILCGECNDRRTRRAPGDYSASESVGFVMGKTSAGSGLVRACARLSNLS
jgi:Predicted integral membrane protein